MTKLALISISVLAITYFTSSTIGNCLKDEGKIVTKELSIDSFNKLTLNGSSTVYLTQGETQEVSITTTQNIIDVLKKEVKDATWNIGFKKCTNTKKGIIFNVTIPDISKLSINGSGDIISKGQLNSEKLKLSVNGSGDIKLNLEVNELSSNVNGSGDITLGGSADKHQIIVNGSGDLTAYELKTNTTTAKVSGSGDAKVFASKKLNATVIGSGDIDYKGNPEVSKKIVGSGDVSSK